MQKINSIQAYKLVKEGQSVGFTTEEYKLGDSRVIKLSVNCAKDVTLYATNLEQVFDEETGELADDVRLLAHVKAGFDQVEFAYIGNFTLHPVGGDVWLHTYDAGNFEVEKTDLESYARIFEREEEDPIIAEFKRLARQNQRELERQRQLDREEFEARLRAMEPKHVPPVTAPATAPATGATTGGATVGAQSSDGAATPADGGANGGGNAPT